MPQHSCPQHIHPNLANKRQKQNLAQRSQLKTTSKEPTCTIDILLICATITKNVYDTPNYPDGPKRG
jgi:hypothetical protein